MVHEHVSSLSEDTLFEKGKLLHAKLLKVIGLFSLIYTGFNITLGLWEHTIVTTSIVIGTLFAWFLLKRNLYIHSKVWNLIQINVGVFLLAFFDGRDTFLFVFYFPLVVGSLIVFQGKYRRMGLFTAILSFIAIVSVVFIDSNVFPLQENWMETLIVDRLLNVVGVFLILILEIVFLIRVNEEAQSALIKRTEELDILNSELRNTLHSRERMLSILAHDIRTPLINVNTVLKEYTDYRLSEADRINLVSTITKQSEASLRMLEDVLNWSRSQKESLKFNPQKVSFAEIESMILDIKGIFGLNDEVDIRFADLDEQYVWVDKNMIESVFRNLISNAVKFSGREKRISISAEVIHTVCLFSVRDNGEGLSAEDIQLLKLGVSFSRSKVHTGSGLGNQLVLDFLRHHETELEIHSELGKGSTFSFRLSLA